MRTVHFTHTFSRLSETFIYDYVKGLEKHGVDIHLMTLNLMNMDERPFENVQEVKLSLINPERIIRRGIDLLRNRPMETSSWPVYRKIIKRMLLDLQPDTIHAHFGPMGALISPVAKSLSIPLVVTFYGYDISEYALEDYWRAQYQELAKDADAVTVLSEQMKTEAVELGFYPGKTGVIHLGTDLSRFPKKSVNHPVRNFVSVGRLSEKKGHIDSIKSVQKASFETGYPLQLTIIGEGQLYHELQDYITENNLENIVKLAGSRPNREVVKMLYDSDAFILSSKTAEKGDREGTPTVLIEAQAAGLPCVSTFHSGIPEIIPQKNHELLAPEGDVDAISECIKTLTMASEAYVSECVDRGRKRVENEFNIELETLKFKRLYEELK